MLTLEVRWRDGVDRETAIASVRIRGLEGCVGPGDYEVGAVERANPRGGGASRIADCVIGHECGGDLWALVERACAELRDADFQNL